jgi:hypothetical protein
MERRGRKKKTEEETILDEQRERLQMAVKHINPYMNHCDESKQKQLRALTDLCIDRKYPILTTSKIIKELHKIMTTEPVEEKKVIQHAVKHEEQ